MQPDIAALLIDVKRSIAIAKLSEFERQAFRLGDYARFGLVSQSIAGETLYEAALANDLIRVQGDETIQRIIAAGLSEQVAA